MSITGELRKWNDETTILPLTRRQLLDAIADRIDIEHEKAIRELNNLADAIGDTCVLLPKDADGEYIHIGDKVQQRDHAGKWTGPLLVMAVTNVGCYVMAYDTLSSSVFHVWGNDVRHYAPTVEDVLREFAGTLASAENNWGSDVNDAIAEYAAKLQLRSDEE